MANEARGSTRSKALVVVLALIALVVVAPLAAAPPSAAVIPLAREDVAVLHAKVADYRSGTTSVTPLAGVTLGLFLNEPSATIDANSGFAVPDATHPVYVTCVSDADGDCSFEVPIRAGTAVPGADQTAPFDNNTAAERGVPQRTRLFVAKLAAPAGYFANPYWQTGPLSPTTSDPLIELRHVWQSPELVGGRTYISGTDWITDPGLQTTPPHTAPNFTRRIASNGTIILSRDNILLPDQCGLNVALVVDVSSSVSGSQGQLVTAMNTFVDALRGTPSQMALFTFGTDSPANGFAPNTRLMPIATTAEAQTFRNLYDDNSAPPGSNHDWNDPTFGWPTNYTNWDRGFAAPSVANRAIGDGDSHIDLMVFLTDGNPTVYGANPLNASGQTKDPNSGYTRFRELSNGLASANLVKQQGTRILAVGVGAGINSPQARDNLRAISGQIPYDGTNIDVADYLQTANYAQAGQALRNLVLDACAPSLSVIKRIVPADGTVDDAYLPSDPWTFEATTPDPEVAIGNTPAETSLGSGGVSFPIEFDGSVAPGFRGDIRVEEDIGSPPQSTFTPMPDETVCVERSTGADVPTPITPDGDTAFSLDIGLQEMVTCTVFNRAPPAVIPASVVVHKVWRIESATGVEVMQDGHQPAGISADLRMTGPLTNAFTPQEWSSERTGYNASPAALEPARTVQIGETLNIDDSLPLCQASDDPLIRPGAPDLSASPADYTPLDPATAHPVVAGVNEWTVLNQLSCTSELTLLKRVTNGPLATPEGEQLWTLSAISPFNDPPWNAGVSGTSGVTAEVMPGTPYPLAEEPNIDAEHYTQHYLQLDLRTRPLQFPESSGSWNCRPQGDPSGDPSLGAEGAVIVPLGQHYECTASNTTALLTVTKTVLPDGDPLAFAFRATYIPPAIIPDPLVHEFASGEEQSLVPGQRYTLAEIPVDDFTLDSLTCETGGEPFDTDDFELPFGAVAQCEAVNQHGNWTAFKASDPPTGSEVRPGDTIAYTVTAQQTVPGGLSDGVVITDDLSGVLDDATLDPLSLIATAGSATVSGSSIVWRLDGLTDVETLTYRVRVNSGAWNATLDNVITRNGGVDCATVPPPAGPDAQGLGRQGFARAAVAVDDCDETHHPTPPPPDLAGTGDQFPVLLPVAGVGLLVAGLCAVAIGWMRRSRRG